MNIKGVITGDIVGSTSISLSSRSELFKIFDNIILELDNKVSPLKIEFYRGDGFQIVVNKPEETLRIAILLRAGLMSKTVVNKPLWDVRVSLGIGTVSYDAVNLATSDGIAFQLSGRGLDEMGKNRLTVVTIWEELNDELRVATAFADDIISNWTKAQAGMVYQSLLFYALDQKGIAKETGNTQQNVSKLLIAAKESLIKMYIEWYSNLIIQKTDL